MSNLDEILIVSGRAGEDFAKRVIEKLNNNEDVRKQGSICLGNTPITNFNSGEISLMIRENARRKSVYVIQGISQGESQLKHNLHEDLFELLIINDSLRRAGVKEIINVVPFLPYMRQDRKTQGREPISAKVVIDCILKSIEPVPARIITVDMHFKQAQGLTNYPIDDISTMPLFLMYCLYHQELSSQQLVAVSPDAGGVARAREFSGYLDIPLAILDKQRQKGQLARVHNLIGDVKDRTALMIDDMIDTGGSIIEGANVLREYGGAKHRVYALCSHGLFSKRLHQNNFTESLLYENNIEVITTDSIPRSQEYRDKAHRWLHTMTLTKYIADIILCNHLGNSVSETMTRHLERARKKESDINDYLLPVTPRELE